MILSVLYFLRLNKTNNYKIGITNNLKRRLNQLKVSDTENKLKLDVLIFENEQENILKIEKYFHKLFNNYKIIHENHKEWFSLPQNYETYIKLPYYKENLTFKDVYGNIIYYNFNSQKFLFCENYPQIDEYSLELFDNNNDICLLDLNECKLSHNDSLIKKNIEVYLRNKYNL